MVPLKVNDFRKLKVGQLLWYITLQEDGYIIYHRLFRYEGMVKTTLFYNKRLYRFYSYSTGEVEMYGKRGLYRKHRYRKHRQAFLLKSCSQFAKVTKREEPAFLAMVLTGGKPW